MSWTEREGPLVSVPERRGFGSIVMEAMVKRSVAGAVDLEYASPGLRWRLTCPAKNALEPVAPVRHLRDRSHQDDQRLTEAVVTPTASLVAWLPTEQGWPRDRTIAGPRYPIDWRTHGPDGSDDPVAFQAIADTGFPI
jgi:hypothetical protein